MSLDFKCWTDPKSGDHLIYVPGSKQPNSALNAKFGLSGSNVITCWMDKNTQQLPDEGCILAALSPSCSGSNVNQPSCPCYAAATHINQGFLSSGTNLLSCRDWWGSSNAMVADSSQDCQQIVNIFNGAQPTPSASPPPAGPKCGGSGVRHTSLTLDPTPASPASHMSPEGPGSAAQSAAAFPQEWNGTEPDVPFADHVMWGFVDQCICKPSAAKRGAPASTVTVSVTQKGMRSRTSFPFFPVSPTSTRM